MAVAESILDPYVNAATLEEAERELDHLVGRADELPVALGDLYDELAEHAADEGEGVFKALCEEQPDDSSIRITLGHARSDAGLQAAALEAFDEALAVAKRRGLDKEIGRARVERWSEREYVGHEPDEDDLLAPEPKPFSRPRALAIAVAWFPPDQRAAALEHWPHLADDFADPEAYARRLEGHLRDLARGLGHHPVIAAIDVAAFLAWADSEGYDHESGEARSAYAVELHRTDRALPWPPSRNDRCWCGSARKYKRCCGAS